jgi:hypothetical protein
MIIANHVLEHVPNWFECFKEMARMVKVGGEIHVWIPPISSDSTFSYRDHINRIGIPSFSGCRSISRAGTNLTAAEEFKSVGHVKDLRITNFIQRPIIFWWTMLAPQWLMGWMATPS